MLQVHRAAPRPSREPGAEAAQQILARRLARGEISIEEYRQLREGCRDQPPEGSVGER